jgi:crotonobetainyl-CoA hydratase
LDQYGFVAIVCNLSGSASVLANMTLPVTVEWKANESSPSWEPAVDDTVAPLYISVPDDNPKPVIAAVNGLAMGGGFEIALACDIIVASEKAVFALPEPRVGLAALAGGTHRLPRAIPLKHAMGMLLTGRRVGAEEGMRLGFVNEVVPEGQALAGARAWAEQILECAPISVRATKQSAYDGLGKSVEEASATSYDQVVAMVKSEDFLEGPRAFAEKRTPAWKGR